MNESVMRPFAHTPSTVLCSEMTRMTEIWPYPGAGKELIIKYSKRENDEHNDNPAMTEMHPEFMRQRKVKAWNHDTGEQGAFSGIWKLRFWG